MQNGPTLILNWQKVIQLIVFEVIKVDWMTKVKSLSQSCSRTETSILRAVQLEKKTVFLEWLIKTYLTSFGKKVVNFWTKARSWNSSLLMENYGQWVLVLELGEIECDHQKKVATDDRIGNKFDFPTAVRNFSEPKVKLEHICLPKPLGRKTLKGADQSHSHRNYSQKNTLEVNNYRKFISKT